MKYFLRPYLLLIVTTIIIGMSIMSCQKKAINGPLDGEWEVIDVTPKPLEWDKDIRLFYNFYRDVCQLTEYGAPFTVGNMVYNGEIMILEFPFIDTPDKELELNQFGILSNPETFEVNFKDKTHLTLSNDRVSVELKKF